MARKHAHQEQAPQIEQPSNEATVESAAGAAGTPQREPGDDSPLEEQQPSRMPSRLEQAKKKLDRMQDTNKICFKHQNDLGRIEDELAKFKYTDAELAHILEPKGVKMIPGFSFTELEKQKQYVNFLQARTDKPASGHAAAEEQRQQNPAEHDRF